MICLYSAFFSTVEMIFFPVGHDGSIGAISLLSYYLIMDVGLIGFSTTILLLYWMYYSDVNSS